MRRLALLPIIALACTASPPPAVPAHGVTVARLSAPQATPAAPAPTWPGIGTDLSQAPPIATARVVVDEAVLMRKPSDSPDAFWPLRRGHLVQLLAREGPTVQTPDGPVATMPARFAGLRGWVRVDAVRDEPSPPDAAALWAAIPGAPPGCQAGVLLADLDGRPGEEAVLHGVGSDACQRVLGVVSPDGPRALGWLTGALIEKVRARPLDGAPTLLQTWTFWQRDPRWTGSTVALWRLPDAPGPLVPVFEATERAVDARTAPTRYELSSLAWPPDPLAPARWLIQQRSTTRTTIAGHENDEATERILRWDGRGFVLAERPPGLRELPPEPPSIIRSTP